jgi:hypothetical protein
MAVDAVVDGLMGERNIIRRVLWIGGTDARAYARGIDIGRD